MVDLRIWILTHPASTWDAEALKSSCELAFADSDLLIEVRIFSNAVLSDRSLSSFRYLKDTLLAQVKVGNSRLASQFSLVALRWQLRQVFGLTLSICKLFAAAYKRKVRTESYRAARISQGHKSMWLAASQRPARLNLFLEDDVVLSKQDGLVELAEQLLDASNLPNHYVCDCSNSYSLMELGIDSRLSMRNEQSPVFNVFNFPFTNTLAANFVSADLLQLTAAAFRIGCAGSGLGIDLDVMRLWSSSEIKVAGCISKKPIFDQLSAYRSSRI